MKPIAACVACLLIALPAAALERAHLGVIVNVRDPLSVKVADYYVASRGILFSNVIHVEFEPGASALTLEQFQALKAEVDAQSLPSIQAYLLTWAVPFRVECMSITSAFAFGFDLGLCADGCKPTRRNAYFNSRVRLPYSQLRIRPTMALAARSFDEAKALIDRGVAADASFPQGTAYLVSTSDASRNVRSAHYALAEKVLSPRVTVKRVRQDALLGVDDVLLYFTGRSHVEGLDTLKFVAGAAADHLTSSGGALDGSGQMSAMRWLEAGATGSYGAVVEPCNMPEKFPHPAVFAAHYLAGDTLIEAYWKSVAMPGQGVFIGEPLAAPFRPKATGQ